MSLRSELHSIRVLGIGYRRVVVASGAVLSLLTFISGASSTKHCENQALRVGVFFDFQTSLINVFYLWHNHAAGLDWLGGQFQILERTQRRREA